MEGGELFDRIKNRKMPFTEQGKFKYFLFLFLNNNNNNNY